MYAFVESRGIPSIGALGAVAVEPRCRTLITAVFHSSTSSKGGHFLSCSRVHDTLATPQFESPPVKPFISWYLCLTKLLADPGECVPQK